MKAIFRMLKPWIKSILVKQMKAQRVEIVNLLCNKISLPMNGELEEQFINTVYLALQQMVEEQIEKI